MSEADKALVRGTLEEMWNRRNLAAMDRAFAPNLVAHHAAVRETIYGIQAFKALVASIHAGLPDVRVTVEHLAAEGDRVAARWILHGTHEGTFMGVPATGRPITIPINEILRIGDGQIHELWLEMNFLGVVQQMGLLPPLERLPPQFMRVVSRLRQLAPPPRPLVGLAGFVVVSLLLRKLVRR